MSKFLENAIKEMRGYGDMGLPDGEGNGGMGSQKSKNPVVNAYKMNNILRRRQQAEEEEMNIDQGMRDAEMPDDEEGMDDKDYSMDMGGDEGGMRDQMDGDEMDMEGGDTEEMKSFFQDNPSPSDEEVTQYAEERGIDMETMRKEVYALIQSLLGGDEEMGMDDQEMGMDDEGDEGDMGDEIEFSVPAGGDVSNETLPRAEEEEAKAPANRDRDVHFQNTINRNKPTAKDDLESTPNNKRLKQRYDRFKKSSWGGR